MVQFNPMQTTGAAGSFSVQSDGYVQGLSMDSPNTRYNLAGGFIASTEVLPMWGGVGIYEDVPPAGVGQGTLGGAVGRATTLANLTGFSVFDQAHAWITTPQSPCPSGSPGMTCNFYRLGSGARIPLQIDPALASLDGGLITQQVSWDFVNQRLVPYFPPEAGLATTAVSWSGGAITVTTATAHGLVVGNDVTLIGIVPAGYNVSGAVVNVPSSTQFTIPGPAANPGAVTTQGSLAAGGGALNVRVINLNIGNSKTVSYDPNLGNVTWNNSGSTALVLI